jgi:drug/metabolite transporter (DMT)-like permease
MFSLVLALVSGLSWGAADFVGGLMTRRLPPQVVLLVSQGSGLVLTGALVLASGGPVPEARLLVYGLLGGVAGSVGLACLYAGLAVGPMSVVAPTAALSGIVPVVAGFIQGDRPAMMQLTGMGLAGAGVVLAARTRDEDGRGKGFSRGFALALMAALFLGLLVLSLDAAGQGGALWAAFMVRASSVPILFVAWLLRSDRRAPTRRQLGALVAVGAFDNMANVLFALASREGLLTLTAVLGSLYPVSTVLLARGFLHERLLRHQTMGVVAAFAGVALMAAG